MLVVNTPEGQQLVQAQFAALDLFARRFPALDYAQTATEGNNAGAVIDAFILKNKTVIGIAEVKSRNMTKSTLVNAYENRWLISLNKLDYGKQVADLLQVPFWGLLYLNPERELLYLKIYDPSEKHFCCEMIVENQTTTGPVINDTKNEPCAFINMEDAYYIKGGTENALFS